MRIVEICVRETLPNGSRKECRRIITEQELLQGASGLGSRLAWAYHVCAAELQKLASRLETEA